jgi:hypothetical protein
MQHHRHEVVIGLQLDTSLHTPKTPSQLLMLQSIATETEITRAALRSDPSWGFPVPLRARGMGMGMGMAHVIKRQGVLETTFPDTFPWPALLTLQDCANNAAHRADCTKQEILRFAISICPYEHIVTVLNFIAVGLTTAATAKALSPLIQDLKAKEARIKQGASAGGKKSARSRQSNSKIPSVAKLLQARGLLIESGRGDREVAGILAQRYGVHPGTIRRKLKAISM